jgi:hypothetical protein
MPRYGLPRGPSYLHHVLVTLKNERGDLFREHLRLDPTTFDVLVFEIQDNPVFMNRSNNPQMPVEEQVAITLFRFRHDGKCFFLAKGGRLGRCWKGNCHSRYTEGHDSCVAH